jgi:hypothetical protein
LKKKKKKEGVVDDWARWLINDVPMDRYTWSRSPLSRWPCNVVYRHKYLGNKIIAKFRAQDDAQNFVLAKQRELKHAQL